MPPNFNFPLCLINSLYYAAMNFSMLALSVKPEFELTFYQLGFDVVLHIGIVISVHVGEIVDKSGVSVKDGLHGCRVALARLDNCFIREKSIFHGCAPLFPSVAAAR